MPGRFPFVLQTHYPHMTPIDVLIWEQFIRANSGYFDSVDYDVKVGEGASFLPEKGEKYEEDFRILTQKKIDAVGYRGNEIWLIEIKPNAGSRALGQILTYEKLYTKQFPELPNIRKCVITTFLQNEYTDVYSKYNVIVFEVGETPETRGYPEIP